tara:strand:+ start:1256 stop:1540 length:285 start_codon:yes stop_codon:yes gene_type:complete
VSAAAMSPEALALDGELTIYRASELKPVMLDAVRRAAEPAFDLSDVSEIDTAGVQLLLLARREAASLDRRLQLRAPSAAVRDAFELLALPLDAA